MHFVSQKQTKFKKTKKQPQTYSVEFVYWDQEHYIGNPIVC